MNNIYNNVLKMARSLEHNGKLWNLQGGNFVGPMPMGLRDG
jgi:hypothetical protein